MRVTVPRLGAVALAVNVVGATAAIALDQYLPAYDPVAALSGSIRSVGSDTLGHEMTLWSKAFESLYPDVKIHVEAAGSATAPGALLKGASQFGPMSRPMTAEESAAFEAKYGYKVSKIPRRGRCSGSLRQQRQSNPVLDASSAQRNLFVKS